MSESPGTYEVGQAGTSTADQRALAAELRALVSQLIEILNRHGVPDLKGTTLVDFRLNGVLLPCGCPVHVVTMKITTPQHSERPGAIEQFRAKHENAIVNSGALPIPD